MISPHLCYFKEIQSYPYGAFDDILHSIKNGRQLNFIKWEKYEENFVCLCVK